MWRGRDRLRGCRGSLAHYRKSLFQRLQGVVGPDDGSLSAFLRRLWEQVGDSFYPFVIVDEVHHGTAASYRPIFDQFRPEILLGLTATPERMDGGSVAADFGNRLAAEIRLPEALEEKLLCPFHYFGVADPVSLEGDQFWKAGKYDIAALEGVYTGAHALALGRLEAILTALKRYEPNLDRVRGIGFCVSVGHAEYMAKAFNARGIASGVFLGETDNDDRKRLLSEFRNGKLRFLFTRDVLNEGLDVPDINTVLFLRPTESLTVFLQQLGRGLRHAPEKDSLTVLDFVGQYHRKYRIDRKLKALLSKKRFPMDREVEMEFPHLPPGCSLQLDRVARDHVLENIRASLRNLQDQVIDRLESFESEAGQPLTFANFVRFHDYEPEMLLAKGTWSEWKARARLGPLPSDPDLHSLRGAQVRVAQTDGPLELKLLKAVVGHLRRGKVNEALHAAGDSAMHVHYRIWGQPGAGSLVESFDRVARNPSVTGDLSEILELAEDQSLVGLETPSLPFSCSFELHAKYGSLDINASMGTATLKSPGQRGVGVLPFSDRKAYILLVTYQKTEKEFSPSTMYADYPISRTLVHWESQSNTPQATEVGQNLIHHADRGFTILLFARDVKVRNGVTEPFTYLGPASRVSYESERPIKFVWRLTHPMPAEMFEQNRRGG